MGLPRSQQRNEGSVHARTGEISLRAKALVFNSPGPSEWQGFHSGRENWEPKTVPARRELTTFQWVSPRRRDFPGPKVHRRTGHFSRAWQHPRDLCGLVKARYKTNYAV